MNSTEEVNSDKSLGLSLIFPVIVKEVDLPSIIIWNEHLWLNPVLGTQ